MACCECCCNAIGGECCGQPDDRFCCKDDRVCCNKICCQPEQYCCKEVICCPNGQACCGTPEEAECCSPAGECCKGLICCNEGEKCCGTDLDPTCCPPGECCYDGVCEPCDCESDEDCGEGECCNGGVCGECEECISDTDCSGGWHCCSGKCYPYRLTCTITGPGTPTAACFDYINLQGGDLPDCCPNLSYTLVGWTLDASGQALLSVTCAAPYPACSLDNVTPVTSTTLPAGYSIANCAPDPEPPDDPP